MDAGAQLWNIGEVRIGPVWGRSKIYELRGLSLPADDKRITQAGAHARLTIDQFDDVDFPRSGYLGAVDFFSSWEALGADLDYNRLGGAWNHAFSFGENTLLPGVSFGAKVGPDLPFYETYTLGGFLNLSGYPFEGLADQYAGLGRLVYYRLVLRLDKWVVNGIYLGGSVEAGGVWNRFNDVEHG